MLLLAPVWSVGFETAHAQQFASTGVTMLEGITVTARKFEESIQHVPFGVTAATRRDLQDAGIHNTQDLYRWVPGFNFTNSGLPFANLLNIRGIGSSSAVIAPAVNYYVDGIPIPTRVFDQRFLDVSQIEVLRGPQGTLFGLNAQAGAVSIRTGDPTRTFEGLAGAEIGAFGRRQVNATLSGPLSDTMAARVSGQLHGYNGDIRNHLFSPGGAVTSRDRDVREEVLGSVSGKLLFTPDADTSVTLSTNYRKDRQRPTTGVWLDDPSFPRNAFNPVPRDTIETTGLGLTVTRELGWAKLTSITGFNHYNLGLQADILDGFIANAQTGFPPFAFQAAGTNVRTIDERNTQWTQELRLHGETAGGIRWVAGASALHSDFRSTTDIVSTAIANGAYTGSLATTNLAGFGEVTVPLTDRLRWIGGLRFTHESKDSDGLFLGRPGPVPSAPLFSEGGRNTYDFVTGRTGLGFDVTPTLTTFATVARGEKPGGFLFYNQFAALRIPLQAYRSASTWSYEAGVRGRPLADRLEISSSIFLNDTRDEQLFTFNPLAGRFDVQNADTRTYGAEFEAKVKVADNLFLSGNVALLRARITGGANRALIGNDVPYAPSVTTGVAAEYRKALTFAGWSGTAFGRIEYQHVGSRQIDPANSRAIDGDSLVNLRAGWQRENVDLYGYVENLFDETYALSGFQSGTTTSGRPVFAGIPGTPRTFGVGTRVRF